MPFDLIKAGPTQIEASSLKQHDALDVPARTITETMTEYQKLHAIGNTQNLKGHLCAFFATSRFTLRPIFRQTVKLELAKKAQKCPLIFVDSSPNGLSTILL